MIRGTRPLELGQWHTVNLSRSKSDGMMIVDESEHFTGSIYGSFQGLDLFEPLYVGGHPNFKHVHRLAGHTKGFVGTWYTAFRPNFISFAVSLILNVWYNFFRLYK